MTEELLDGLTITTREAVRMASDWWDKTGRHLMRQQMSTKANIKETRNGKFRPAVNGAPAIKPGVDRSVVIPSKILQGHAWEELDAEERSRVVAGWLKANGEQYLLETKTPVH